jgi:regulator of protease activity HflC (stomatin/prohibitin superfamily)
MEEPKYKSSLGWIIACVLAFIFVSGALLWGCPQYNVYKKQKDGEAKLRESEYSRRVAVEEAIAKKDSAVHLAAAEVERAKGVAEANKIIGTSLRGNESYLIYLWIQGLNDGRSEVIYVPTEANLPILEATRRKWKTSNKVTGKKK